MTDLAQATAAYRSPNKDAYPELAGYSWHHLHRDLGPGGLYLAVHMTRHMRLQEGDVILDLGCGLGETSIYLAQRFGVQVVAVDLWTPATTLAARFAARGCRQQVLPLQMDVTGALPFAKGYFDAVFCMNSLSFYGGSVAVLRHLLKHLKRGGILCVGSECFDREFTPQQCENPPQVFAWQHASGGNVWDGDFVRQHSPPWWARLFEDSGLLQVLDCRELEDGVVLLEDTVRYNLEHGDDLEDVRHSVAQLAYGRTHSPHQTLFVIAAQAR